jgi:DNA (cytosine-5)-methyltransferase 1
MITTGSDFSGVGAFDQALMRLGIKQNKIFACDMDKYARQTYIHNYGEPKYYPENVYDREIPEKPLSLYMTSPPCQSFSLAGKRKGEDSDNGVLFYNSLEFIKVNNPRYFIFENVKGLLSDNGGKTFAKWIDCLGGRSVNGNPVIFPHEDSVPYHVYHRVLNAKKYGIPQNRERIFIIGIRDDIDNTFTWPVEVPLVKCLRDILESDVDEKYFLSDKMIDSFTNRPQAVNFPFNPLDEDAKHIPCLTARYFKMGATDPYIKVNSNTKKGYEIATENDSINFTFPESKTRRGRVGKGVVQTLDTACNQGVLISKENESIGVSVHPFSKKMEFKGFKTDVVPCLLATDYKAPKTWKLGNRIRRLMPRECFRAQDFPDTFTWPVSDTQAYKQAGNSIAVGVLSAIISKLKLKTT